jgi:hypothetical protein
MALRAIVQSIGVDAFGWSTGHLFCDARVAIYPMRGVT